MSSSYSIFCLSLYIRKRNYEKGLKIMRVLNGVQYSDINMLDSIHISLHLYKQHKLNRRMSMYRLRK